MNKSGLIDTISNTTSLAKREAEEAVNALIHVVVSEVRAGRRVAVTGFGSFNPTHRGARVGRNPQTGEPVKIAASKGVRFAASSTLKGIVNGKAALPPLKTPSSSTKKGAKTVAAKAAQKSTARTQKKAVGRTPAVKTARKSTTKVVRRSPATKVVARAPARKRAKRSANKAVRRAPAKTAKRASARKAKRSAKKAVRRA